MDSLQSLNSEKPIMIDALIAAIQPTFDGSPALAQYADGAYWEQIRDLGAPLERILRGTVANYRKASHLLEDSAGDAKRQMDKMLQFLPSFLFSTAAQLSKEGQYRPLAKQLQLAAVGNFLHNNLPGKAAADFFMQSINPNESSHVLSEKLKDKENNYLPRIILADFFLIGKYFNFPKNIGRQEMVEKQYLTTGLHLIFLKYYFELLSQAPNDAIAEHVDTIFLRLLVSLKQKESQVWSGVTKRDFMEVKIQHVIDQNKPPYFFKDRFALLKTYHPLIREKNDTDSPVYYQELKTWQSFSIIKLILFANTIHACKGPRYVTFLLLRLHQLNKEQFFILADYLAQRESRKKYNDLYLLMQRLAPVRKRMIASQEAVGGVLEPEDPNIYPDIESWGPHLQKFHQQIKMSGMLSEEELPVFFRGFAESALEMLREKEITDETLAKFKNTVDDLMEDCVERSSLNIQEVKIYQKQIDREMEGMQDVAFDERAQKIDNIGMVLCEARKKQNEYEQLYREALPIELILSEDEKRVKFTVEKLLLLPLPNRQKERFLETYVPSMISDMMMMAIYNLNLTNPDGADVTDSVYDIGKNAKLKTGKLIHLLEQSKGFESFVEKQLISVPFNKKELKIPIQDFFLLPLSSHQKKPEKKYFTQHLKYLRLQTNKNAFPLYAYEIVLNNLDHFTPLQYKQYFNIFQEGKLEEEKLEALIKIWKDQGLGGLRA